MKEHKFLQYIIELILFFGITSLLYLNKYYKISFVVLAIYFLYLIMILWVYWKKDNDVKKFIRYIKKIIGDEIFNYVMPMVLIRDNGQIVWHNDKFNEFNNDGDLIGKSISSVIRDMDLDKIIDNESTIHQKVEIDGGNFDVHGIKINQEIDKFILLYLNDMGHLLTKDDMKENIIMIEVDNLNDVLEATDESNRPLVVAEVERTINAYATNNNAMIKKYDTNKYILSMQNKFIEEEIKNQFTICDSVSKIEKGNKHEITISMGVGRGGISPLENSNYATTAIELALGRGGDQVVIKNCDDIKFFGGNSKEIEKRTRVRARVVAHALKELIYESDKVYIIGHDNPDMDCFGSAVALSSIVRSLGKECNIVLNHDIKAIDYFLGRLKEDVRYYGRFISIDEGLRGLNNDTLVIVVDVHNKSYVSGLELVERAKKKVIIDHHRRSPDIITGTLLNYIEVYASSTSEMITEMIQYISEEPDITAAEAEGLLAGIFMDTKGFSFKTGVRTFEAASFLKKLGADTMQVKKMFTDNLSDYLLIAETIKSAKVDQEKNCAIAVCPNDVNSVIIAKSADKLLTISGILVSFVIGSIDDEIYISGRSVGDINVQVVLEALGGGGHMNIAGTKISGISLREAELKLNDAISKYLKVGE